MFKNNRCQMAHDGYHSSSLEIMLVGVAVMFCALFVSVNRFKPQTFPTMTNQGQFQSEFAPNLTAGKPIVTR